MRYSKKSFRGGRRQGGRFPSFRRPRFGGGRRRIKIFGLGLPVIGLLLGAAYLFTPFKDVVNKFFKKK